jgi:hypothetical protein
MRRLRWVFGLAAVGVYGVYLLVVWIADFAAFDAVIGDVLIVTRSQVGYAELNGGFSEGDLSCLVQPGTCIPSQRDQWQGRSLVSAGPWTESQPSRWTQPGRRFTPGPAADAAVVLQRGLSKSSVSGFRYVAEVGHPWWTALSVLPRSAAGYCGDATGHVCELSSIPLADGASCPPNCRRLE